MKEVFERLVKELKWKIVIIRELGGILIVEKIWIVILDLRNDRMDEWIEVLFYVVVCC